ncbi:MAG: DUF748 domain-containing protein [Woeseiaceae bacterium]|nr:DUF748 domain-containing protein [Woeseiaceae bacterium]
MRKAWLRALLVIATVFALYSLAGFELVPHLVERWLITTLAPDADQKLDIEGVAFNPYTFEMSLTDVTLIQAENPARISVDRIDARLFAGSLLDARWLFRDRVEVFGIEVDSASDGHPEFTAEALSATGVAINTRQPSIAIEAMHVAGPLLEIERSARESALLPPWLNHPALTDVSPDAPIDTIVLSAGRLVFLDRTVRPTVEVGVNGIDARLSRDRSGNVPFVALSASGRVVGSGNADLTARWQPPGLRRDSTVRITLSDVDLPAVSPYATRIIGRKIVSGRADIDCSLEAMAAEVSVESRLVADDVRLANPDEHPADAPSFLTLALLEDPSGQVRVVRRARFDRRNLAAGVPGLCRELWREFFAELPTAPFEVLAKLADWQRGRLDHLAFEFGSAELSPAASEQLLAIAGALRQRPLLGLTVQPGYDSVADRRALATRQLRQHVTLATSARPPGGTEVAPLDVGDVKVRNILDEFASTRLRPAQRRAINTRFPDKNGRYYEAVFEELVQNEEVSETALQRLARYRARAVADALVRDGIDDARLDVAGELELMTSGGDMLQLPMSLQAIARR